MIDLSEKSREELFREKKEAEFRAAKMREGEWKRRKDKERKHIPELEYYEYYRQKLKYFKLSNHVFKMCKECQRSRRYMKKLMIRIYEKKLIAIINMTYCCRVVFVMMFYGA